MHYGLIGHPLGHSLSVQLHSLLRETAGVEMDYRLFDTPPDKFTVQIAAMLTLDGYNVTIPYKQKIMPLLHRIDESARRCCAVNTVKITPEGTVGYNTDCVGFLRSLRDMGVENPRSACIIGAGGAGQMMAAELASRGADVSIAVRQSSIDTAGMLAQNLTAHSKGTVRAMLLQQLYKEDGTFSLLANASPCGMHPNEGECPVTDAVIARSEAVFDCIYNPLETSLIRNARRLGKPAMGGLRMLVWQAMAAHEIWYGAHFTEEQAVEAERRLAEALQPCAK